MVVEGIEAIVTQSGARRAGQQGRHARQTFSGRGVWARGLVCMVWVGFAVSVFDICVCFPSYYPLFDLS